MTRYVDVSDVWATREQALAILGISNAALILLRRDGLLEPDCVSCGRIRWRVTELRERRDELHAHLIDRYGTLSGNLIDYAHSDNIGVSR